jgi:hypothetical protein
VLGAAAVMAAATLLTHLSYRWRELVHAWLSTWPTPPTGLGSPGRPMPQRGHRPMGLPSA